MLLQQHFAQIVDNLRQENPDKILFVVWRQKKGIHATWF